MTYLPARFCPDLVLLCFLLQLAGIVLPHPNVCMLPDGIPSGASFVEYSESLTYDYPSVGQIAQALRDQDIIPIFAAEQSVRAFYDVSIARCVYVCEDV